MRDLLHSRRGSVAFATVIALVPLIGVVSLGAEAGSWYVTRQQAQNAADSAAYSGALRLACTIAGATCDTQSVDYRGKEFAAQNAFCNSNPNDGTAYPGRNCPTSLPTRVSRTVQIDIGDYNGSTFTTPSAGSGNAVRAKVSQQQPAYLSAVLGLRTVNIPAQAIASVKVPPHLPCVLAKSGAITFQDASVEVNAPNCGLASNGTPTGFEFKVAPRILVVGSMSTAGGCSGDASLCGKVLTFTPPVIDPFSALASAIAGLKLTKSCGSALTPYTSSNPCYNDGNKLTQTTVQTGGVYFFSGLDLKSQTAFATAQGISATIILLPGTSLNMAGGSSINITAPTSAPSASALPSQLASVANLLSNMALFDPETSPKINGNATIAGSGVFYLPNADPLNWQGSSTGQVNTCTEVIAASIKLAGTPNFNNSGCAPSILLTSQTVALVQ